MQPRIIKTEEQYREYLAEVERLATEDPAPGTLDGDRLELLAKLVEDYEKERYKFASPDPIDAIRFRMEERGLKQKDLAPMLGGKNRVSEVLARKRPLTLPMVRALNETLDIPAELLIRDASPADEQDAFEDSRVPLPYLLKSGWFSDHEATHLTTGAIVQRYLKPQQGPLSLRHTITYGATASTNKVNLRLWVGRVRELAEKSNRQRGRWIPGTINEDFLSYTARLSWSDKGPRLAQEFLAEKGIAVVLLPALPQTKLDGAAMQDQHGAPVIGLTIRHDRLDNYWFTLLHELVHVWKHLPEAGMAITDESIEDADRDDPIEVEANRLASHAFIPRSIWIRSEAYLRPSYESIHTLANKLHISAAVIAGRLRREKVGYGVFGKLVGQGQVKKMFPDVRWR